MNKNEDKSVIPLCLKNTFHSVPHRIVNEWHCTKTYYVADVNDYTAFFFPPPLLSNRCHVKLHPSLNTSHHSSLSLSAAHMSFIPTLYLKSPHNSFFVGTLLLHCIHPREGDIFKCNFFWHCSFSYTFSFAETSRLPLDPFRNKEWMISHHCYWYISLLLIFFLYCGVFPWDLFFQQHGLLSTG